MTDALSQVSGVVRGYWAQVPDFQPSNCLCYGLYSALEFLPLFVLSLILDTDRLVSPSFRVTLFST